MSRGTRWTSKETSRCLRSYYSLRRHFGIRLNRLFFGCDDSGNLHVTAGKGCAVVGVYVCFDERDGVANPGEFLGRVDASISCREGETGLGSRERKLTDDRLRGQLLPHDLCRPGSTLTRCLESTLSIAIEALHRALTPQHAGRTGPVPVHIWGEGGRRGGVERRLPVAFQLAVSTRLAVDGLARTLCGRPSVGVWLCSAGRGGVSGADGAGGG